MRGVGLGESFGSLSFANIHGSYRADLAGGDLEVTGVCRCLCSSFFYPFLGVGEVSLGVQMEDCLSQPKGQHLKAVLVVGRLRSVIIKCILYFRSPQWCVFTRARTVAHPLSSAF